MNIRFQSILPYIVAIAIFAIISMVYFSPVLDGNQLKQNDTTHYIGMSKEIKDYKTITGERILWSNNMFSGMPSYQTSTVRDGNWLGAIGRLFRLYLPGPIGLLFTAMLGFYILCLCMKIDPWLGILGALGFGLASFFFLYLNAGHATKMYALAYIPPTVGGVLLVFRKKYILGAALTALFLGLHIYSNHLQVTYYLLFLLLAIGITKAILAVVNKDIIDFGKSAAVLIVAGLIGLMPSMTNLLLTSEYSTYTTRGKTELTIDANGDEKTEAKQEGLDRDYILEYNMGKGELFASYIPNAKGGTSGYLGYRKDGTKDSAQLKSASPKNRDLIQRIGAMSYWGKQNGTAGAFYYGAIIIFLFFVGMAISKNHIKWGLLVIFLMACSLALKESSLGDWFIENVPMYDKFRDSKMILMLVQVILPLVAVLGINQLIKDRENLKSYRKPVLIAGGAVVFLTLLFVVTPKTFFDFNAMGDTQMYDNIVEGTKDPALADSLMTDVLEMRVSIFKEDATRTLLFVLGAFALLLLFVFKKINRAIMLPILGLLILIDMVGVDLRYLNTEKSKGKYDYFTSTFDKKFPFKPAPSDLEIMNLEQSLANDFEENKNILIEAHEEYLSADKRIKQEQQKVIEAAANFGALSAGSNYRVFKMLDGFSQEGPIPNYMTRDAELSYFHKSLDGYHGAKLKRYQELIDFHILNESFGFLNSISQGKDIMTALDSMGVINMLNTKYLIIDKEKAPIVNAKANGNAWFVNELILVPDANAEILRLGDINTKTTAVMDKRYKDQLQSEVSADSTSYIEQISYHPDVMEYESFSSKNQLAVFSEMYYEEGWKAYVDNEEVPIIRVNYVLRAIEVPSGEHQIVFKFEPAAYKSGKTVASIGSILVILLLLGGLFFEIRKVRAEN